MYKLIVTKLEQLEIAVVPKTEIIQFWKKYCYLGLYQSIFWENNVYLTNSSQKMDELK